MKKSPSTIKGHILEDERGKIRFINDFDLTSAKRFYLINNADNSIKRGWNGHKIESRWFSCISGSFTISIVEIKHLENFQLQNVLSIHLSCLEMCVLHVPPGYATLIEADHEDSTLIVFADYGIEHSQFDSYKFPYKALEN